MGMKQYAIDATNEQLDEAVKTFRLSPSAQNWALLSKSMKAHQIAHFEQETTLERLLVHVPKFNTIEVLAQFFDEGIRLLENEIDLGLVRLVHQA